MGFNWILEKIAWNYNEKQLAKYSPRIEKINKLFNKYNDLSNEQIKEKSLGLKIRLQEGKTTNDILEEAFALHKQACKRLVGTEYKVKEELVKWKMIPYDVQLLGGMILNEKKIAEMRTGEWKTLVATLIIYLNALEWKGTHLITVNDYLAERDAEIMRPLYEFLGLTIWFVTKNVDANLRRIEYEKDITYVENSELGFDYLKDNLVGSMDQRVLLFRPLNFAVVDEADSIMIDEARTPLIISQPSIEPTEKYEQYSNIVKTLNACPLKTEKKKSILFDDEEKIELDCDYKIDLKAKTALLTSKWITKLEKLLWVENLYKDLWYDEIRHIENALKAKACYIKDKDYLVYNGEVLIIDENTGRAMIWRRYSEWLHQAIEAKEGVEIKRESETIATITYQNFLKLYKKLAWMTGTAATEWEEFEKIYDLEVLVIPTNKPIIRIDKHDTVFFDQTIKFNKIVDTVSFYHKMGVPFLLWTSSVQTSEILSEFLRKKWLQHSVLNAKYNEMEAKIISTAWKLGSIIVATNMAWRWTDIKLEDGLFDKLSDNYSKWINTELNNKKGLSLDIYSDFETNKLLNAITNNLLNPTEITYYSIKEWKHQIDIETLKEYIKQNINNKIDFSITSHNIYIEWKFNKKKKNKDQVLSELIIKRTEDDEPELIEKDIHLGLYVLASEKHENRRIDNQLRWRAWRQWDPGITQFYVALDDDLMLKSGGLITKTLAWKLYSREELENMEIENKMITKSIERSQKQMEAMSFSMRKNLFEYDSVLNKQRKTIYKLRDQLLTDDEQLNVRNLIKDYITDIIKEIIWKHKYNKEIIKEYVKDISWLEFDELIEKYDWKELEKNIIIKFNEIIDQKEKEVLKENMELILRQTILSIIDKLWMEHINDIMYLKDKVSMYWYAQMDPLLQYKKEGFEKYQKLIRNIKIETISNIMKMDTSLLNPETQSLKTIEIDNDAEDLIAWLKEKDNIAIEIKEPLDKISEDIIEEDIDKILKNILN